MLFISGPTVDLVPMLLDIYDALIADQRSVHSPEEIDSATSTGGCPSEDRCRQSSFSSRGTYSSSSFTSVKSYQRDISSLERCKTRGSGGSRPVPKKPEPRTPLRTSCVWSSSIQNDNRRCDTSIIQMPNTTDTNHNHQNEGPVFSRSPYRASHGSHRHYHQSEDQDARRDKRPLSISSTSSAMSSSSSSSASSSSSSLSSLTSSLPRCQGGQKKSYLASIESLEDDDQGDEGDDDDDDDEDEEEEDDCAKTNSSSGVSDVSSTNSGWGHRSETGRDKVLERNGGHCNATVTSPPPPTQCRVMRYCDPNLTYTDRVVIEIVDTERTYVRDLSEIIEVGLIYCQF